jgi:hypothetical protein
VNPAAAVSQGMVALLLPELLRLLLGTGAVLQGTLVLALLVLWVTLQEARTAIEPLLLLLPLWLAGSLLGVLCCCGLHQHIRHSEQARGQHVPFHAHTCAAPLQLGGCCLLLP